MRRLAVTLMLAPLTLLAEEPGDTENIDPAVAESALAARAPAATSNVMDELDLDRTEITGNQELPKVLYIVPWKSSDLGDLVGRPVNSLLDEVLAPVDREVFARQVDYYQSLNAGPRPGDETGSDAGNTQ